MPDPKRINAPDNTVPYQYYTKKVSQDKLVLSHIREDGRNHNEHRKIFIKTGVVTQAKGSGYIEVGKTKVIVSVFDPREIPNKNDYSQKGELYCDFKYAPFSCKIRRGHQQDTEEKQNSILMKQALEPAVCRHEFPNFQVDIYAIVLENDGSALSAAITCAGIALAQAGVPMYDLIVSTSVAICDKVQLINPTYAEEVFCKQSMSKGTKTNYNHGLIIFSMLKTHQQISEFYQTGNLTLDIITDSIQTLTDTCKEIIPLIEQSLIKYIVKSAKEDRED